MRLTDAIRLLLIVLCTVSLAAAQSTNGTVSGIVLDPGGRVIPGANIEIVNDTTGVLSPGTTNREGIYAVSNLPPGQYRIQVSKIGFKTLIKPDIVLNVQDALSVNFTLPVGARSETVTVEGGASLINTESGAVSTVVGSKYVENMPLNGRSFQNLILLTPGVVTSTPQQGQSAINGNTGEFSVNGQRTESNYYTVDGVSANVGIHPGLLGAGTNGSVAAATALGTTQALVSIDALQEFRVESSTYSAEYGRNPGGQFSFVTRSGTSDWHGTGFDYLRNDVFDANNWFNDYLGKAKPPLRQNDFGGTLGGPLAVPIWNRGPRGTFFFFSYEGLRVKQPQSATLNYVPNAALRQTASGPLQLVMNGFPSPNGPDLGNGLAEFIDSWSNPSSLNAYGIRADHSFRDSFRIFFRYSDTDSSAASRGTSDTSSTPSVLQQTDYAEHTYTAGVTSLYRSRFSNEFRINHSSNTAKSRNQIDNFGGAQSVSLAQLQQVNPAVSSFGVTVGLLFGSDAAELNEGTSLGQQQQWNLADSLSFPLGRHGLKIGVDYRRLTPVEASGTPSTYYYFYNSGAVQANSPSAGETFNSANVYPLFTNFSAFLQDEWRMTERLNLSLGLRWEVNPPTGTAHGLMPYTVQGLANLATMSLAPRGTPLWRTTWYNFAPRLGAAYMVRNRAGSEMVLRGGAGLFFDTAQQSGSFGFEGPGFAASRLFGTFFGNPASFPLPPDQSLPPISSTPTPPYPAMYVYPAHLQLPYTIQWNFTVEQALGKSQAITLAGVGSHASRLLEQRQLSLRALNADFTTVNIFQNGLAADYDALQLQFQRRLDKGLSVLGAYTYSHSIDYGSTSLTFPYARGNSDLDVRQNFSAALSYDLSPALKQPWSRILFRHWGIDDRLSARSGFPVTLKGLNSTDPASGQLFYSGLNLVSGQPLYLHESRFPGGREINPSAFSTPAKGQAGDAPRNRLRGFGAWQMDLAVRHEFPIHDLVKLQFRGEAFNTFNHPNFGLINPNFGQPTFGQATSTLNNSLGVLNSLYQMGGPRSLQFALKLIF